MTEQSEAQNTVRATFAAYGQVMAKIGAFEQLMRLALAKQAIDSALASGKDLDTRAVSCRLLKMDFGSLAQQLCDRFELEGVLRDAVKQAKELRNTLAHNFWVTQFPNLRAERGLQIILRECALYDEQFERVSATLMDAVGFDVAHHAAAFASQSHRPEEIEVWEALLEKAEATMCETSALFANLRR
jgi:hypothetical protein